MTNQSPSPAPVAWAHGFDKRSEPIRAETKAQAPGLFSEYSIPLYDRPAPVAEKGMREALEAILAAPRYFPKPLSDMTVSPGSMMYRDESGTFLDRGTVEHLVRAALAGSAGEAKREGGV